MTDTTVVSTSLIVQKPHFPLSKEDGKCFCLGLVGWCPCDSCNGCVIELVNSAKSSRSSSEKEAIFEPRKGDNGGKFQTTWKK